MLHAKGYGGEIGNFNVELDEIMMQENNQEWDWLEAAAGVEAVCCPGCLARTRAYAYECNEISLESPGTHLHFSAYERKVIMSV